MKVFHQRAEKLSRHLPSIAAKKIDTQYALIEHQYSQLRAFEQKLFDQCRKKNKIELERREKWNDYIAAIEQNLTVIGEHLQTNDQGLMEIDLNLRKTIEDFHQRQAEFNEEHIGNDDQRWQQIQQALLTKQQQVKERIQLWNAYRTDLTGRFLSSSISISRLID